MMESSKIVMISGIYLILGMYSLSFHKDDTTTSQSVVSSSSVVQAEKIARAGISLALEKMGSNSSLFSYSVEKVSYMNGTISHEASRPVGFPSSQSKVTSTGYFNDESVTVTAVFSYERGRWRILKVYQSPAA